MCVCVYVMKYYLDIKNNEIMSFVATWMNLEIITLSDISQRQIPYDITYMRSLKKNDINELIYKTGTDSQTLKTNLWLPKGKGCGEG